MFPPVREAGRQDQPDMVAARHTYLCRCWLGVPCLGVRPASPQLWGPRAPAVPRLLPAVDLPHPPRCCRRSASCVTVLSRRPGGRVGPWTETWGPGGPRGGGQRLLPPSRGASEARTSVTRPGAMWRVPCLPRGARVSPCVGRPPALPAGPGKWSPHGASRVLCPSRPRPAGPPWGEAQAAV